MEENDKIIFFCKNCKVFLKTSKDMAGKEDNCPNCGEKVVVLKDDKVDDIGKPDK